MSTRYGDKARSGEPVSNAGKRSSSVTQKLYEQEFVSPGTWTWPGLVTHVEVLLVGGGGGSGSVSFALPGYSGAGGGGGVRLIPETPVSGPVPVTIGAGGAGGSTIPAPSPVAPNATSGSIGGTTSFGPLSVGGGGGGYGTVGPAVNSANKNAPPTGGGGGGSPSGGTGGTYGCSTATTSGGGAGSTPFYIGPSGNQSWSGVGRYGYGAGGYSSLTESGSSSWPGQYGAGANGIVNSPLFPIPGAGNAGTDGVVVVRWWQ